MCAAVRLSAAFRTLTLDRNAFSLIGMLVTVILILFLAYWVTKFIGQRGLPGWARGIQNSGGLQVMWQEAAEWLQKQERVTEVPSFLEVLKSNLPKKK